MQSIVRALLRYRGIVIILLVGAIAVGIFAFTQLDIEAYPDPAPPMVEFITQNPAWSAEEMEQQVTVPIEAALNGTPHLDQIRSISIFGLSDVKLYFSFDSKYFDDRQEALNRLQSLALPGGLQPQLSPESPVGEIYRYELAGPYSLNELKATQDWLLLREIKQVPGIIDVASFGGTTRQYQADIDPNKLRAYGVTMTQVLNAIQNSNANAGGNYLTLGSQSVNVRGIGLLHTLEDMQNIVVVERNGTPVKLSDLADVRESYQPRMGKVGLDHKSDIVEAIVLLQKGEKSLPALDALHKKIAELNRGNILPKGMHIKTIYDRTALIGVTTHTVQHVILMGLLFVTLVLLVTIGDLRITSIAAFTIPVAVLFAFTIMVFTGASANLISIGAIDFGILIDASIVVLENIYRNISNRRPEESNTELIVDAVSRASRPVLFSTAIILISFIPLFTMQGVPGKIFAPMSETYGLALIGALLYAVLLAPVISFISLPKNPVPGKGTRLMRAIYKTYRWTLRRALHRSWVVWVSAVVAMVIAIVTFMNVGGEFMPALEEGNLWIRATMHQDISFQQSEQIADRLREILKSYPEVKSVISQMGRPDDGTDVSTFNNIELLAALNDAGTWRPQFHKSKDKLIESIQKQFDQYPGIDFNFSQNIQDNVEEAMSGVKGENSLKLFGPDLDQLTRISAKIEGIMKSVQGITDIGVFDVTGQPSLMISIDRAKAARYGLQPQDINSVVQSAVGGAPVTQIMDGDRRFNFAVRYTEPYRSTPEAIASIQVTTPDGNSVPLGQIANVEIKNGAFEIYREAGKRYIPIKFSVRNRDMQTAIQELQHRVDTEVKPSLPTGYEYTWAGQYDDLQKELHRLTIIVPISLAIILLVLYLLFNNIQDALIVLGVLPFGAIGGILTLFLTHTPFSISAAVGFTSLLGLNTLSAVVFLTGIRHAQQAHGVKNGILQGALDEMRPIVMATFAAGLGLLPAAVATGIGAQTQQPLARVVVGGTVTTLVSILFLVPLLARKFGEPELETEPHS